VPIVTTIVSSGSATKSSTMASATDAVVVPAGRAVAAGQAVTEATISDANGRFTVPDRWPAASARRKVSTARFTTVCLSMLSVRCRASYRSTFAAGDAHAEPTPVEPRETAG